MTDYTVEGRLNFTSNVPEALAKMVTGMREFNDLLKGSQDNLKQFATELRELTSGTRGINRLVTGMKALADVKFAGGLLSDMTRMAELTREMATSQREFAEAAKASATATRQIVNTTPRGPKGSKGGGMSHGSLVDAAFGLQMGGDIGTGFFEKAVMANFDVDSLLANFRQNVKITDSDADAIRAKAEGLARSVPGTFVADNLHTILDAYTVTGNIAEAMNSSGAMAKLNLVLKSLPGAHHGDPGYAAAQAVEVMQRFYSGGNVDMGAMNQQLGAMTRVAVGTGGRADPTSYLAFAKQARLGGMLANDEFLYRDLPAVLIALNGSRAGTGDAATYKQFFAGRMTKNAAEQLETLGIIDHSAVWHGGQVRNMGQHLRGADLFRENEVQWVREILLPQLSKKGVNVNDRASLGASIASWASTQTGLGFLSELALGMPGINKEASKIGNTNADPMSIIEKYDPLQKLKEFQAAENELMVTIGKSLMGPAIDSLKALTDVLQHMSDWAKANPHAAKDILVVSAGMAVFSKAIGDIGMIVFFGAPVIRGFASLATALGSFAVGGAAASGLASLATGAATLAAAVVPLGLAYNALTTSNADKEQEEGHHFRVGRPGAYVYPPTGGAVHTTIQIDGRTMAKAISPYMAGKTGTPGVTGFDPRMSPTPTGATP